ncbi:hypothetical protein Nepgr_010340 [Nepenthes gracilis]|uniref:Pentatricopeptide repeat-containing protein n=1 Tax=Nepenthes gracilis TaxID=150966 RepID=A0AAD3SCV7_NEPGR|nr:hypothetical protein Nepgr_010340 [Nepenthes gracilis]
MMCKVQCLDVSCFQVLNCTKTSNIRISVPPLETHDSAKKIGESNVLVNSRGGVDRIGRFHKQSQAIRSVVVEKRSLTQHGSAKNPGEEQTRNNSSSPRIKDKVNRAVRIGSGRRNTSGEKSPTKCSTKCLAYGGCIPSILRALDTIKDLDEAFRPWEERLSNKERSIILKEQASWERALEIFEWFKRKGCYELNVIHYNIMLRILGKARKWGEVESIWDEMRLKGIKPINSTFGTLIDVCTKGGKNEEAVMWLQRMNDQGMEPDEMTMGIVVQMYKKAGEFKKAEQFFKMWSSGNYRKEKAKTTIETGSGTQTGVGAHIALSSYTYNTLIDTYGKAGQLQQVSETFSLMLRDGVVPDTITFNTMIHIYGNHDRLEEVNSVVNKMEEFHCPPDTRTFNILISLYAKNDDITRAVGYFMKMKEACLEPDLVSYRTLLYAFSIRHMVGEAEKLISEMDGRGLEIDQFTQSALARMYIEAGMLEKSWLWFERFHMEGNMSSECYSANIDAYGEHGHVMEAEKAFACCQERKRLSVLEFNVMIKAYGIGKRYNEACQLFDRMENHGVIPDRCSYVSLIQTLAGADLPHIAKPYLLKMQESGLTNDCIPYCAVISSFAKLGQLESAEELFKVMIGNDVQPDVVVYGVLINAFAESGGIREAMFYVDAMRKSGLPLNAVICSSLIKLYTKVGYLKEAEETYRLLQSFEGGPDQYSSNCMIDLYSDRSMIKEAEKVFNDMQKQGDANEFSFSMMLCLYKRIGRLEEAMKIAKIMQERRLLSELLSYNSVLSLFMIDGRFKEGVGIFRR